jgi:hypothetical protein
MIKLRMRWAGHVAHMRDENAYKILVGKPETLIPIPMLRWKDNIKTGLRVLRVWVRELNSHSTG